MIFGSNPIYLYGELNKNKYRTPERTYILKYNLPVEQCLCPAKLIDNDVQILFEGPIFNSYVESIEDNVSVIKSYDSKITICKKILSKNLLYTLRIKQETDKFREVEMYKYEGKFPGRKAIGKIEMHDNKMYFCGEGLYGNVILQNNVIKENSIVLLYKIVDKKCYFVEIKNPVERCKVHVVKELEGGNKLVENGEIKGILVNCKSNEKEINVYVKKICLGSYIFVEDLVEGGIYNVNLVRRKGNVSTVIYKNFIGECFDQVINKVMKGKVYEIKGNTFKFKRCDKVEKIKQNEIMNEVNAGNKEKINKDDKKNENYDLEIKKKLNNSIEEKVKILKKTSDFEEVVLSKEILIEKEEDIAGDQFKAIKFIENEIKKKINVIPLFNKYMCLLEKKDHFCLFYIQHLIDKNIFNISDFKKVVKITSPNFLKITVEKFERIDILEFIYEKKKTKQCYIKLLEKSENPKAFIIKYSGDFTTIAIDFAYKKIKNPREIIESIIDEKYTTWECYLKNESGNYKRGLFRRAIMCRFRKEEMKKIFENWLEFEESVSGNIEEVKQEAENYIKKLVEK